MTARVVIPTHLRSYTAGEAEVRIPARTVEELLRGLDARYPGIRHRVVDEQDHVREHIRFVVAGTIIRSLHHPVGPDEEVRIIAALSGG